MQFRSAGSRLVSGTFPCCSCAAAGTAAPSSPCREGSDAAVGITPPRERQDGAAVRGAAARVGLERTGRGAAGFPPETATKVVTARASCRRKSCRAGSQPEARLVSNLRRPALPLHLLLPLLLLLLLHVCFCSSFFLVAQSLPLRPTASAAAAAGCRLTHHGEPCVLPFGPASVAAPQTQQVSAATIAARTGRTVPPASPATAAASPAGGAAAFISSVAAPPPASRSAVAPSHTRVSVPPNTAATTSSARPPRAAARSAAAAGGASGAPEALPSLSAVRARDVDVLQAGPQQQRPTVYAVSARGAPRRISGAAAAESAASSSACAAARHPLGGWGLLVGAPGGEVPSTSSGSSSSSLPFVCASPALSPSSCSSALGAVAGSGEGPGCAGTAAPAGAASPAAGDSSAGLNKQLLVSPYVAQMLYEDMLLGRSLEDACFRLYYQGKTAGFVHLYTGQEAVSSGVIKLLRQDDAVISTYRDHVHASSKGVPAKEIMAELYGKSTGCSKGRGGSMHMFSKKFNMIGGFAFIGEQIPVALGYAFSAAYRRFALTHPQSAAATDTAAAAPPPPTTAAAAAAALPEQRHDQVTVCFLGDGATNIGQLWEALNIAALAKLPIIFVVENNNWAIGMAAQRSTAIPRVWQRAETFGVAGVEVDGMDVLAVRSVARRAIERARKGEGPTLIEALTYRFRGHSVADPDEIRAAKQKEAWVVRDPILAFEEQLKLFGFANDDTIRQTRQKVETVMKEAVQFAETSAESPMQECGSHIFAPAYRGGAEAEKLSDQELHAYAEALKEELDWKARRKAGSRTPRPPITQAFKPPTIID